MAYGIDLGCYLMYSPAFLIKFTVYRFLDALALRRAFDARSPVYRCFACKEPFVFMRDQRDIVPTLCTSCF